MKIVVFTADEANGGVKQLVSTITRTCLELGHDTIAFFPENRGVVVDEDIIERVHWYKKIKTLNPYNSCAKAIASLIEDHNPDLVIMPEGSIFTIQVLLNMGKKIKTALIIHDVTPHPSNIGIKRRLTYTFSRYLAKRGIKKVEKIVLLSENSYRLFKELRPEFSSKAILYTLGGHIPFTNNCKMQPKELPDGIDNRFMLFFGRIDKYKGIDNLVTVYKELSKKGDYLLPLLIAGRGNLSEETREIIRQIPNIYFLNRFIDDLEMVWLFDKCKFVVLPYIQASQSGVLPISYAYGKPVVASNIDGLKEYVDKGETGFLFNNEEEFGKALLELSKNDVAYMSEKCKIYSNKYFNWKTNTQKLIQSFVFE